jgi:hypothetical protein
MIDLKNTFKRSIESLPRTFRIEDPDYLPGIGRVALAFTVFSGIVFVFVMLYVFIRFSCNKCVGPTKLNQITKTYRNITWFLVIISFFGLIANYSTIIAYSVKMK